MHLHLKPFERYPSPNGRAAFVFFPETNLQFNFHVAGQASIFTATYREGALWANANGADFPEEYPNV